MKREDILAQLFESMAATKRAMHGHTHELSSGSSLSRTQLELLFTIGQAQPVNHKQLAELMQLTAGAISQLVDSLSDQSLIKRLVDPTDRRIQMVELSKKGVKLMAEVRKTRHKFMKNIMESLTTDELAVMLRIQQKLISKFQSATNQKQGDK